MTKYHKILKIRAKDVAFTQWTQKLRIVSGSSCDNTIRNSQIEFTENDFGSYGGDQSSVVSSHL
jgi:hypothetical protein